MAIEVVRRSSTDATQTETRRCPAVALAEIFKEFTFEAAHRLPHVPEATSAVDSTATRSACAHVAGPVEPESGWLMDFADMKEPSSRSTTVSTTAT